MRRPFYIIALILTAGLFLRDIGEGNVTPKRYFTLLLWIACCIAPLMLLLWVTLTVALRKLSPIGITFNGAVTSVLLNAVLLLGMLCLLYLARGEKPLEHVPAFVFWSMSFVACTLGYWGYLGRLPKEKAVYLSGKHDYSLFRKHEPAAFAKRFPDGLNTRKSLYIALFLSALQQPYYYLVYTVATYYNIRPPLFA